MRKTKRIFLKKLVIVIAISFSLSCSLYFFNALKSFEYKVYDLLSRNFNPDKKSDSVCLIYIDQRSIEELSTQGITWPWPRQIYAPVVEYLSIADAVFIDLIFTENSSYGVEDDQIFAKSVKKAGNVYLPVVLSKEKRWIDEEFLKRISVRGYASFKNQYQSVITPIEELKLSAKGFGNVSIQPDEDGIYRRISLFFKIKDYFIPNFVMTYFLDKNLVQKRGDSIFIEKFLITNTQGSVWLRYSSNSKPFRIFSFVEILSAAISKEGRQSVDRNFFRGKKVFIGASAAGLFDMKPTPVSSKTSGVFIHATLFENLISGDFITTTPKALIPFVMFLVSTVIASVFIKHHSMKVNLLVFIGVLFFLIFLELILFKFSLYMEFLPSLTSLILSSIISLIYSYATEGKEKSFIKRTFSQYMDKRIVDYLLSHPELISAGGQKKTVTVFFADIEGFTSISEKLSPEDTAMMLYKVLNALTEVVIRNYGVVDKYIGDCIMAFWGAPLKTEKDEFYACTAAIECQEAVEEINKEFQYKKLPEIRIRVGIHTGDVVVGNIGSDRLFNYTVIGDTVNIASRLESANKFFRTKIIISEDTYRKVSEIFITRQLGIIIVKGKAKPIAIYEVLSKKDNANIEIIKFANNYNMAYSLFIQKRWNEAKEVFKSLIQDFPDDIISKFYLNKIEEINREKHLTEDWFIVKIEEK